VEHVVIVGGGLAGHRALQALREFEGKVTLVSDEEHKPYDRPPLSKQVLLGEMEPDATFFKVEDLDVQWVLGDAAAGLDTDKQVLTLASGKELEYDGLVIATGRRAREWPGELPDLEGFFMLRSLDDSIAFKAAAKDVGRIAIVGAGFIGCEVAASMRKQGVEHVTLIEMADQPMPSIGPTAGAFAQKFHEDEGVTFKLSAKVTGFKGQDGRVTAVEIEGDDDVEADVVLLSLGSAPNSEWLEDTGITLDRGNVCCNEYLFVEGAENVVAAGDIAAWTHPHADTDDGRVCIEHWTTSREMAKAAVTNLLAEPDDRKVFLSVPTFWSDQYDVKIKSAGYLRAADRLETVEEDPEKKRLVVEAFCGDELVGAIIFNKNKAFITYQKQLREALADS
jgi:NADPH-dependent 2,4-dienoyl-CoA reductase/sulfur reductase-like enzyme